VTGLGSGGRRGRVPGKSILMALHPGGGSGSTLGRAAANCR
jgi:hypothetical protein